MPSGQVKPQLEVKLLRTYGETQLVQFEADPEQAAQLDMQVTQSNPSAMVPEGQVSYTTNSAKCISVSDNALSVF